MLSPNFRAIGILFALLGLVAPTASAAELTQLTKIGGSAEDTVMDLARDSAGNIVLVGITLSPDFPTTSGVFRSNWTGGQSGFVMKVTRDGERLIWSTYFPGIPSVVVLDDEGSVYIVGDPSSTPFPVTPEAYQRTLQGDRDLFISKLSSDGSRLIYSTLFGGTARESLSSRGTFAGNSPIVVGGGGAVTICGVTNSPGFLTGTSPQTSLFRLFIAELSPDGSRVTRAFSTQGGDCSTLRRASDESLLLGGTTLCCENQSDFVLDSPPATFGPRGNEDVPLRG